jgi:UDP-hydrolysing UDP-N-acetyl-D-glucosamine 2-epimerase
MHLDRAHGRTIDQIRREGWRVDATVPWRGAKATLGVLARETGRATAGLAEAFEKLGPDIVMVVGDRVEAFAAATAGHLSGRVVAHVHGGDRALGQVDDALRHAITKLAHVHFAATAGSAQRIVKLGEDPWRVHQVGSPGVDGITTDAWPLERCVAAIDDASRMLATKHVPRATPLRERRYALLLLHPTDADDELEYERADKLFHSAISIPFDHVLTLYPNNDPGSGGILRCWDALHRRKYHMLPEQLSRRLFVKSLSRGVFLGLLRGAAVLAGNSSSGIIEAASFGTPVIDVGPRQSGRERGANVTTVPFHRSAIRAALAEVWNGGEPIRYGKKNPYGRGDTARRIARVLAGLELSARVRRKLIAY